MKTHNYTRNVDGTMVICNKIDGITVISNLVRPPIKVGGKRARSKLLKGTCAVGMTFDFEIFSISICNMRIIH